MKKRMTLAEYKEFLKARSPKKKKGHATRGHVKGQWFEADGKRFYCRSKFEYKRARELLLLKRAGEIKDFHHEPEKFWFPQRSGNNHYTPDFQVIRLDGSHYWEETKGWLDQASKVKIKRFNKYYPDEELILIHQK